MAAVILKKDHLVEFLVDYEADFKVRNTDGKKGFDICQLLLTRHQLQFTRL